MEINVEEVLKSSLDYEFVGSMLQKLNEMRKENKYCDVSLEINNKDIFKVHKAIISSSSDYFNGLFNGDWKESREDVISLDYEIIPECFELLLEYLYTVNLNISVLSYEYALILHKAALFFNLLKLKDIMSKILQKFITSETMLDLWRHGVNYFDDPLRDKCLELISEVSTDFLKQNLLKLTFEELKSFCENKTLNCTQEEIYENFITWTKADFEPRERHLRDLLDLVDFSKISGKFVKSKIFNDEILFKNEDFVKKIISELSKSFELTARNINESTETDGKKLFILLISDTGVFKIDLENRVCQPVLSQKINDYVAVTKLGFNKILLSGGFKSNACKYYCPEINSFQELPPMQETRFRHNVLVFGDKIYVFGGVKCNTMEIYDEGTKKWSFGPTMPRNRWGFALEEYGGYIYLMGGFDGLYTKYIPTDVFDIKRLKWETYSTLVAFDCSKAVRIDSVGYLFKTDGYQKYDFKNKTIQVNCFTFPQKLFWVDAVEFNDFILVVGIKGRGKLFWASIDILTEKLTEIEIDAMQCTNINCGFRLATAYLQS